LHLQENKLNYSARFQYTGRSLTFQVFPVITHSTNNFINKLKKPKSSN